MGIGSNIRSGSFLVYGGTRGVGLLISEQLFNRGFAVTIAGRSSPTPTNHSLNSVQLDFSITTGFAKNRDFLQQNEAINKFIFNLGGSFGVHEDSPKIDDFQVLSNLNIGYIIDTVNFLESTGRLHGSLLVFMLSNVISTGGGNLPYRILKVALDDYARSLEASHGESFLTVLRFYPPLILYPNRFMAKRFLAIESDNQRRRFIDDELAGFAPVHPEALANDIVSAIIKKFDMNNSNECLEKRVAG